MANILIVEDDVSLNNGIVLSLKQDDDFFFQCYNIEEAKSLLREHSIDLILLDINLPDGNGMELCQEIRKTSRVAIIFLTANDMEIDVVSGLALGADDYITKPFSLMILRARVAALLRRTTETITNTVIIDEFIFNFEKMKFQRGDKEIILSKTEQKLLHILIKNRGIVLSRSDLVDKIWEYGTEYVDENALSVTVSRLRGKLERNVSKPHYIQTIYGIGYTWRVK